MKILHLYPPNNPLIARYVSMAEQGMRQDAESLLANDGKAVEEFMQSKRPDILHLHGCSQPDLVKTAKKASRQGVRVVLTPHGEIATWCLDKSMASFVAHAYAITTQSPMEHNYLARLGWNDRLEIIKNPIITRTTTATDLVRSLYAVYQKVLASDVLALMDGATKQMLKMLLKAGITADQRWLSNLPAADTLLPDWQKIYVYAEQEGVLPLIVRGIKATGLQAPTPSSIPIYLPNGYRKPEPAYDKTAMELLMVAKQEYDKKDLSLLRLAELDSALRDDRLDEEVLLQELKANKLTGFFSGILQILSEQTGLDEGFMPCMPANNQEAKRIRTIITNHLKI